MIEHGPNNYPPSCNTSPSLDIEHLLDSGFEKTSSPFSLSSTEKRRQDFIELQEGFIHHRVLAVPSSGLDEGEKRIREHISDSILLKRNPIYSGPATTVYDLPEEARPLRSIFDLRQFNPDYLTRLKIRADLLCRNLGKALGVEPAMDDLAIIPAVSNREIKNLLDDVVIIILPPYKME